MNVLCVDEKRLYLRDGRVCVGGGRGDDHSGFALMHLGWGVGSFQKLHLSFFFYDLVKCVSFAFAKQLWKDVICA